MLVEFTKMQGLGNDFVVIDAVNQQVELSPQVIQRIADRHYGVGCDQLLLITRAKNPKADFGYTIYNADGAQVEQCGNGARCFARFVRDQGLTEQNVIQVETLKGQIRLELHEDGQVTVDMGIPELEPVQIPFLADTVARQYEIEVDGRQYVIGAVSMGNPHAVMIVEDIEKAPVESLGAEMERHARFPQRVNVGFLQRLGQNHIKLRVYERGVGETQACGSGACAAVVVGHLQGLLGNEPVTVDLRGGQLVVSWQGPGRSVFMTGPAVSVFEGRIRV